MPPSARWTNSLAVLIGQRSCGRVTATTDANRPPLSLACSHWQQSREDIINLQPSQRTLSLIALRYALRFPLRNSHRAWLRRAIGSPSVTLDRPRQELAAPPIFPSSRLPTTLLLASWRNTRWPCHGFIGSLRGPRSDMEFSNSLLCKKPRSLLTLLFWVGGDVDVFYPALL